MAQTVKNLPAVWETQVQSLGLEDPLEKGMATHSSILAWRIPWTEESGELHRVTKSQTQLNQLSRHAAKRARFLNPRSMRATHYRPDLYNCAL